MKKVECLISDEKNIEIEKFCRQEGYTKAEFARRAFDKYLSGMKNFAEIIQESIIETVKKEINNIK